MQIIMKTPFYNLRCEKIHALYDLQGLFLFNQHI
jgi:hypothetical protein